MTRAMKRGRSQVLWRYLPGAVFRYSDTGSWCQVTKVELANSHKLTPSVQDILRYELRRWSAIGPGRYPDPDNEARRYVEGEPHSVYFDLWPIVFACKRCGRVAFYSELGRLQEVNPRLRCRTCREDYTLLQLRYGLIHQCGRIDPVFLPKHDSAHEIVLLDKGNFRDSAWFCRTCQTYLLQGSRAGLGIRACPCESRQVKSGVTLEDPSVHFSQTMALVDIADDSLEAWRANPRFGDLLLAASVGSPAYRQEHWLDLLTWRSGTDQEEDHIAKLREVLGPLHSPEEVDELVQDYKRRIEVDPWEAYDADLPKAKLLASGAGWGQSRRTIEYVFVKSHQPIGTMSLRSLATQAQAHDASAWDRMQSDQALAGRLGISDLSIIEALPLKLIGFGYTRRYAEPRPSNPDGREAPILLQPYPETGDHRLPIYVTPNTTEGLLIELDPWQAAAFLQVNAGVRVPAACTSAWLARAWLLGLAQPLVERGEAHLVLRPEEQEAGIAVELVPALLFGLIHSLSHVLKAAAHRFVGMDSDTVAEYLFPAHLSGILYVAAHVQFTLGGMDSLFRSNLGQLLTTAHAYAGQCAFDPVCAEAGGACLACVYPKFGCSYFNRTVSRSFLFGGSVAGHGTPLVGYWDPEVTAMKETIMREAGVT